MNNSTTVAGFDRDIASGVPIEIVVSYAKRHLDALIALPAGTDGRDEEMRAVTDFLLRTGEGKEPPN